MRDITSNNFGLLIAYVLPGFAIVWGLGHVFPVVQGWLGGLPAEAPTVGGFLFVTIASVASGLTVSTLRWLLIDTIHHATGVRPPDWDFSQLASRVSAFETLIEIHYRYYQWYANALIALPIGCSLRWSVIGVRGTELAILIVVEALCFIGSRDTLQKYYRRGEGTLRGA